MVSSRKATPKAIARLTTRDLEWAAGFLEGEGSFVKTMHSHNVTAPQRNLEPLLRLQALFGGTINTSWGNGKGKLLIPRWYISGTRARGVMMTLYTLLSKKRQDQIIKVLHGDCSD